MIATSEIEKLEQQHKDGQVLLNRRKMAMRLAQNRDFKTLILEEFCVQECARYAQNSANPALSAEDRADSLAIAQAAGHLKRFMQVVMQMGAVAERELAEIEAEIEELRSQDADEDADTVTGDLG